MNKKEAIAKLREQQTWSTGKAVDIVNRIGGVKGCQPLQPKTLEVGDFYYHARIRHPGLIVENRGELHMVVGLTTSGGGTTATEVNSRYTVDQYAYPSIQLTDLTGMEEHYMGSVTAEEATRVKLAVFDFIKNSRA